jgi:oligopeptide transport system substrate-binding protein
MDVMLRANSGWGIDAVLLDFWFKRMAIPFRQSSIFSTVTAALLLLFMLASCATLKTADSSRSNTNERVFRVNLGTEPPDLDPAKTDDLTSYSVLMPLMKGLTEFDANMAVKPAIAQSWNVERNGLGYVFHLRPDARWSDGKPVTSFDFKYAWLRALKPETGAPYAFFLFEIENAKAFYDGKIQDPSKVGILTPDARTLRVNLRRPTPIFLELAASPIMLPLRRDVIEKHGERFTEAGNFIANGAYQLAQWTHEEKIRLVPNPEFYEHDPDRRPQVDAIDMLMVNDANTSVVMYENGELDFIETQTSIPAFDVRRLRKRPDAHTAVIHRINYFGFNITQPPFNNVKVRQAFAHALDRSYYPRLMQSGERPLASWISPGLAGHNPNLGLEYNPEKARKLLAEAGYPGGKGFPAVKLAFRTQYDIQKESEIAQYLWKKNLGVDVRLENMEWKVFLSRLDQDPPALFRLGWFVDYPDADSYMNVFLADSGNNHTRWRSPEYDALVEKAVVTRNPAERRKLYDQAQRLLLERDTVIIPIYAAEKLWLVKPHVRGLEINALNLANYDRLSLR